MLEDLQLIVKMITDLPTLAVWVLAGFLVYKLAIVGSLYGTIRFAVDKWHNYLVTKKVTPPEEKEIRLRDILHGLVITSDGTMAELIMQLRRLVGKGVGIDTPYIHTQSVQWLREAIDEKLDRETVAAREKAKQKKEAA